MDWYCALDLKGDCTEDLIGKIKQETLGAL